MSAVGATDKRYTRILLKLSGEALAGDRGVGFDFERIGAFADQIVDVARMGVQLGLVIGGGNIVRGKSRLIFIVINPEMYIRFFF